MNAVTPIKRETAIPEGISAEEWAVRVDLAALYRLCAHYNWTDLIYTHISARVPGPEHHFLINPYGMMFQEITASSLLKVDHEGNVLTPSPYPFNKAGFVIHGAVHMAREDAHYVIHLHTKDGVAVSAQKCGLLPLSQHAMATLPFLAYHDYEGIALDEDERVRLVADLGDKTQMILRNHGTLVTGTTASEAWVAIHNLERSCSIQVAAMAGGTELNIPSPSAVDTVARQVKPNPERRNMSMSSDLAWPAMLRMLDAKDSGFRN